MTRPLEEEKNEHTMFVVVAITPEIEAKLTKICEGFADIYEVVQEGTDLAQMRDSHAKDADHAERAMKLNQLYLKQRLLEFRPKEG